MRLHTGVYGQDSALKFDFGRKIPCRTMEPNLRERRVGPTLHHLGYILAQLYVTGIQLPIQLSSLTSFGPTKNKIQKRTLP